MESKDPEHCKTIISIRAPNQNMSRRSRLSKAERVSILLSQATPMCVREREAPASKYFHSIPERLLNQLQHIVSKIQSMH